MKNNPFSNLLNAARQSCELQVARLRDFLSGPDMITLAGILMFTIALICMMLLHVAGHAEREKAQAKKDAETQPAVITTTEVALGEYRTIFGSNQTAGIAGSQVFMEFEAAAVLSGDMQKVLDVKSSVGPYRNRIRQVVLTAARSTSLEELNEPDLSQFRARIRSQLNTVLEGSAVEDVLFTGFQAFGTERLNLSRN